jgi:hypothetical protein
MKHRLGLGPKNKQAVADELTPGQLRAERQRREREARDARDAENPDQR